MNMWDLLKSIKPKKIGKKKKKKGYCKKYGNGGTCTDFINE